MEKLDIILWAMGGGFAISFAAMRMMWSDINKRMDERFDKVDQQFNKVDQQFNKVDQRFEKIDQRFDKLEEKVEDIDRRLCRIEGGLSSNSYCALSNQHHKRKHHG